MQIDFTTISMYLTCPKRVQYKLQGVPHSIGSSALLGQIFHFVLAEHYRSGAGLEEIQRLALNIYSSIMDGGPLPDGFQVDESWDGRVRQYRYGFRDNIDTVLEGLSLYLSRVEMEPAAVELQLERDMGGFVLRGRVDAICAGRIIDWKLCSGSYKPSPLQAACYALLVSGPCQFEFHLLRKSKEMTFEVFPEPLAGSKDFLDWTVREVIQPVVSGIEGGIFPANPTSNLCTEDFCDYYDHCIGPHQNRIGSYSNGGTK